MKITSSDMVFVGSGISCTYTLLHYLQQLKSKSGIGKAKITVLEKSGEFWTGVPYGSRSDFNSLIITSLKEFVPEAERSIFISWLNANLKKILQDIELKGGQLSEEWILNNNTAIENEAWEDIYVPRFVFGSFLKERITQVLDEAIQEGTIECELIEADVTAVKKTEDYYEIWATGEGNEEIIIKSQKVILSVGSPPKKPFKKTRFTKNKAKSCFIEDMYEPRFSENLNKIYSSIDEARDSKTNNVLIIGSNASALEVLYNFKQNQRFLNAVKKIYILSPDGKFPHKINKGPESSFELINLQSLKEVKTFTAQQILEAVKMDVSSAEESKIPIADIIDPISILLIDLLNRLNFHQQKLFVSKYGVEIGKFIRRAGGEYRNAIDSFVDTGKAELIKGKFLKFRTGEDGALYFDYSLKRAEKVETFPIGVRAIINCSGFQNLTKTSSSLLISNLIKDRVCLTNTSRRGFTVNENFEAQKDLYVIGPLLAGNINDNLRVWHAESCNRIFSLSKQLAEVLAK